ncbi:Protein TOO MANY MOUTHS [Ananas comosus]|uniref:Protein TOO MANY MOUTHS n=1 Tax=Ananas comosus TaxID=4615 RepID=A0A199VNV6_ANACO|nr:Protein TOO MANY MOUTHS [Ananas comosus]
MLLLLLLLLSLPPTNPHAAHSIKQAQMMLMDPPEKETLFRIMEAMSSDRDWRGSTPDPCSPGSSWPGIECKPSSADAYLHVTRLDFGASPNPSCRPNATFPSQLVFDLPFLQSLFFFRCFTSAKTTLSFPLQGAPPPAYASLQQLSLRSNPALLGAIPPHISLLTSLQVLTLSQNHLHGSIPRGLGDLTSLVRLDLSYNSLSGPIPPQIAGLKSLVGLDLSYNSLTGAVPPAIGQLPLLQKLDLSSNKLTGSIPESVESLGCLVFLALSNNMLSGRLPDGLQKLQNLQCFIMDDNPMFAPLPAQLGRLANLQELRLASSGYSGTIPGSFASLSNLTTLSLENNNLTGEIPAGLSGLRRMYHLNLSRNMLSGVVPFNAGFLRRLGRNLDLGGNVGLCLNDSESYESAHAGVDVCGDNSTGAFAASSSSMQKPLAWGSRWSFISSALWILLSIAGSHTLMGVWEWYYVLL